jgi:hypothetical protein
MPWFCRQNRAGAEPWRVVALTGFLGVETQTLFKTSSFTKPEGVLAFIQIVLLLREKKSRCGSTQPAAQAHRTALFAWLISHQSTVLFSQNKPATSNQPTLLFSQHKPASTISHQPKEHAAHVQFVRVLAPRS